MILTNSKDEQIVLPDDLVWADEYKWNKVEKTTNYAIDGTHVVEVGTKRAGRPITLQSPANMAWVSQDDVKKLQDFANLPDERFTLTHATGEYKVWLRSFEATPIRDYPFYNSKNPYSITLELIEL